MSSDILFCADSRFALGAWVSLWSVWKHWQGSEPPRFHLLTSDPDGAGIRRMGMLAARRKISLTIHPAGLDAIRSLPVSRQSAQAYLRILAPEMLPDISRFLYLDADLLVRSSVHPVLEDLPPTAVLAAAQDFGLYTLGQGIPYFPAAEPEAAYFNTGVLAVNSEAWRAEGVTARVLEFLGKYAADLTCSDQDGMNGVLQGRFHLLDPAWNVQLGALDFFDRTGWPGNRAALKARREELLASPKVVHFIGAAKPWNDGLRMPYGGEYRDAIFESGWIDPKWKLPWKLCWLAGAVRRAVERRRGTR
jgi:lipopolysaccharide biosynthesis glycosyltransferase